MISAIISSTAISGSSRPVASAARLARRHIATTGLSRQQQQQQQQRPPASQRDPSHPYLYYHPQPTPAPGQLALSFLPDPPVPKSRTVLGYLPLEAASLSDFKENHAFRRVVKA